MFNVHTTKPPYLSGLAAPIRRSVAPVKRPSPRNSPAATRRRTSSKKFGTKVALALSLGIGCLGWAGVRQYGFRIYETSYCASASKPIRQIQPLFTLMEAGHDSQLKLEQL